MPIEMPKGVPFSVDTWTPSSKEKRHHFLTHAHKDHSQGISTHFSYPIYSTHLTKSLTLQYYPQLDDSLFVGLEAGQSVAIRDPDGDFTVTAFDANHCPGAIMFLFEGNFGSILHTGDCRLNQECLQNLPEKYLGKKTKGPQCRLDYIFLDCTFGRFPSKLPSRHSAIRQVINCIWKHPGATVVYLTCDMLGQEEILVNVSQTFGSKIFIAKESNPECYQALKLTVPEILAEDSSSRFHVFDGFPNLPERAEAKLAEAQTNSQPEPLIIRPSVQWYACDEDSSVTEIQRKERFNKAIRDNSGIWHVCYSMHSSREELEWALKLLAPKWVVSTTPPCRAMELTYVKKHCFINQVPSNDPIWKLLDISVEVPRVAEHVSVKSSVCSSLLETFADAQPQPISISSDKRKLLNFSPPSKRGPLTLFGRARLGLPDSDIFHEQNERMFVNNDPSPSVRLKMEKNNLVEDSVVYDEQKERGFVNGALCRKEEQDSLLEKEDKAEEERDNFPENKKRENVIEKTSSLPIGSMKRDGENLRKLYRSLNGPVPRPLPSLVELLNSRRNAKRRFQF